MIKHFSYYSQSMERSLTITMGIELGEAWNILDVCNGEYKMGASVFESLPRSERNEINRIGNEVAVFYGNCLIESLLQ